LTRLNPTEGSGWLGKGGGGLEGGAGGKGELRGGDG